MNHLKYQSCIIACHDCAIECARCGNECLSEASIQMLARCLKLTRDCTDICLLAVNAMASDSEFAKQICSLCEEICTACANECEKHSHLEHCLSCEAQCRLCSIECSKMSKM